MSDFDLYWDEDEFIDEWVFDEEPDEEPEALHVIRITTQDNGKVSMYNWTNDNLDTGYPSEDASWTTTFPSVRDALRSTGGSRYGLACRVEVYVDGKEMSDEEVDTYLGK